MRRIFLIGMLCGVIITAAVALLFTIPANTFHWRMEIWKRGGAAWTFDRNGHLNWRWTVKPVSDVHLKKAVIVPSSQVKARTREL
jgi:gas vesicle protein